MRFEIKKTTIPGQMRLIIYRPDGETVGFLCTKADLNNLKVTLREFFKEEDNI